MKQNTADKFLTAQEALSQNIYLAGEARAALYDAIEKLDEAMDLFGQIDSHAMANYIQDVDSHHHGLVRVFNQLVQDRQPQALK